MESLTGKKGGKIFKKYRVTNAREVAKFDGNTEAESASKSPKN